MPNSGGLISEAVVKNMITDALVQYERHYGEVRHRENTGKFDSIFRSLNKFDGAVTFGKVIAGFIAFLCMAILGLLGFLATRHNQSLLGIHHPDTYASAPQYSRME